jgi:hypothetical protein
VPYVFVSSKIALGRACGVARSGKPFIMLGVKPLLTQTVIAASITTNEVSSRIIVKWNISNCCYSIVIRAHESDPRDKTTGGTSDDLDQDATWMIIGAIAQLNVLYKSDP